MRAVYSLLLYLALPFALLYFAWRGLRESGYLRHWGERLGLPHTMPPDGLWLHAASVGEVNAAAGLVKALRRRYPDAPFLVTVFTPTGRARAEAQFREDDVRVAYVPLDLPGVVGAFMRRVRPALGVLVETELWPNLIAAAERDGVPMAMVNARISEKSYSRYARWPLRGLIGACLGRLTLIAAASDDDARRLVELGADSRHVHVSGNLKFDVDLPAGLIDSGRTQRERWGGLDRPVWVAASTHDGEERLALDVHAQLRERMPNLLLVLAPRHPQRFDTVARLCRNLVWPTARLSAEEPVTDETAVLLADTLGELPRLMAAADVTFVGGSLVKGVGGHNVLEPAAMRIPVICGPHMSNWTQPVAWLAEAGALLQVSDAAALAEGIRECLEDDNGRMMAGLAAERVVQAHSGALERSLRLVTPLLTPAGRG